LLSGFRALDLTDEKGFFCGLILARLGVDVIKVERPGGDTARKKGPFYHDIADSGKSLYWFAYNVGKRGITLNIESTEGQDIFRKLVKTADFIIESFPVDYLDRMNLGYQELRKINPRIILTSITPFGQTGPYKHYKSCDIVAMAMGGMMIICGEPDRPPLRLNPDHAYCMTGINAVLATLLAHHHRETISGKGQHVDVSMHDCIVKENNGWTMHWQFEKTVPKRMGAEDEIVGIRTRAIYPCKDGHVVWVFDVGHAGIRDNKAMTKWLKDEGIPGIMEQIDWDSFDAYSVPQEKIDAMMNQVLNLTPRHTKRELEDEAMRRGVRLSPVKNIREVLEYPPLVFKNFGIDVTHPELSASITYPGRLFLSNEVETNIKCRPPLIGEHNDQIYIGELGLSKGKGANLHQRTITPETALPEEPQVTKKMTLDGVKVLEWGTVQTGPAGTSFLSDFGAQVIKVESTLAPDMSRTFPPHVDGVSPLDSSAEFSVYNSGKMSITIDLKTSHGVELFKRLVAWADVVVQNYRPGAISKLGLGYEELRKIRPDIIMINASIAGQEGPGKDVIGLGQNTQALGGMTYLTGYPDGGPQKPTSNVPADVIGSTFVSIATLVALDYRRRTGKGQCIDVAQLDPMVFFFGPGVLDYTTNKRIQERIGNCDLYACPHGAFRCKGDDEWCAIAVFTEDEWKAFCRVIGNPDWTKHPRFATFESRKKNEDELERLVEEWTINHTPQEVMTMMQSRGVPAGVLQNIDDIMERDPQVKERRFFRRVKHPLIGEFMLRSWPFILSETTCEIRAAPLIGQDNHRIITEILGMSEDEFVELVNSKVLI
jgi:crotonobetainyl-CoA:carnitine CoA-transferase CaiB-like acyl-CoA transferase